MYHIIGSIRVDQSHRIVGIIKKKKNKAELSGQFIVNPYPELPFWVTGPLLFTTFCGDRSRPFGRYKLFRIMA